MIMRKFIVTYINDMVYKYMGYEFSYDGDKFFIKDKDDDISTMVMLGNVASIEIRDYI